MTTVREVSISSTEAAPIARGFPWPVVELGNASYGEWTYSIGVENKVAGSSIKIKHEVKGALLLDRLASEGKVLYICTVADPYTMYREVHRSDTPAQLVEWQPDDLGNHPMFTPMIVSAGDIEHKITESDGISDLWVGRSISLVKGSRLAVFPAFALSPGLGSLLEFALAEGLDSGQFKVEASTASGFKFKVSLARDLFDYLRHGRQEAAASNVMTHIVSSAFAILKQQFNEDNEEDGGWKSIESLRALSSQITEQGLDDWTSEDFDPAYAATVFYPHKIDEH